MFKLAQLSWLEVVRLKLSAIKQRAINSFLGNSCTISVQEAHKHSTSFSHLCPFYLQATLGVEIISDLLNWSSHRETFDMQTQVLHRFLEAKVATVQL